MATSFSDLANIGIMVPLLLSDSSTKICPDLLFFLTERQAWNPASLKLGRPESIHRLWGLARYKTNSPRRLKMLTLSQTIFSTWTCPLLVTSLSRSQTDLQQVSYIHWLSGRMYRGSLSSALKHLHFTQHCYCNDRFPLRLKRSKDRTKMQRGKCSWRFIKNELNTEIQNNKRCDENESRNSTVWWQTLTRKQTPTNQQWNPGYLSMILNQRQLTTPTSDWEPY